MSTPTNEQSAWLVFSGCVLSGLAIAAALPPWGWWPSAFAGLALFDRMIADQPRWARLRRGVLMAVSWLAPGMFWMWDLTAPGYVIATLAFSLMFGIAAAMVPGGPGRRIALPGAFVLAELARWYWPFGGVPLATLPMTQVNSPLAPIRAHLRRTPLGRARGSDRWWTLRGRSRGSGARWPPPSLSSAR